ncbi:hypothetical protein D5086_027250 [Populus alba]|uniref:Uncharacterized protein n=1 Tax=Populus alba TaxID=43335 RepID=A0ACC4AVE7_POPAL
MLKMDHRYSKATEFSATGASKPNASRKTHRVKAFRLLRKNRNAGKLTESKRFAVCGRKCDIEQVAEAYMLKRDHPKFQRQLNSGNGGIEVEMP